MTQTERAELSPEAEQRIADVVRSLAEDKIDRGVDLNRPMHCASCDMEKAPLGSSQYGDYALCNDCLLEFTLLLARGQIDNVSDYMTKRVDGPMPLDGPLEPSSLRSMPKRAEKLMPSNEPI